MREIPAVKGLFALLCGICLPIIAASGAELSTAKGFIGGLIFTDNSNLDENDKDSEVGVAVAPYLSLRRTSAGTTLDLSAQFEYNSLASGSNKFNPRVQAAGNAELKEDFAFFDARFTAGRNVVDPFRAAGRDAANRTGNQTTTYTSSLSPYAINRFASFADLLTRYAFVRVVNTDNDANDSDTHAFSMALNSGANFPKIPWGLIGDYTKTRNEDGGNIELKSADVRLGYKLSRKWKTSASVGREWNDFDSIKSDEDGFRWDLHMIWTPSQRTNIDIGYGRRFFGSTPSLDLRHRTRRSVITATYARTLTTANRLLSEQDVFQNEDAFGDLIPVRDRITNEPQSVSPIVSRLDSSLREDERFRASYTLVGRRTTVTLRGDYSKQTPQDTPGDETFQRYGLNLNRQLSRITSVDTSLGYDRDEDEENESSDTWYYVIGMNRRLTAESSWRLAYTYSDRDSDREDDSYKENRINLSIRVDM